MDQEKGPKTNRLTLYFSSEIEREYLHEKNTHSIRNLPPYSIGLAFGAALIGIILPALQYHYVLRDPLYLSAVFGIILMPLCAIALSYFKGYSRVYEHVNILGGWLYDLLVASTLLIAPLPFVKVFFTISILKILLYTVSLNFRLPAALLSASGSAAIYLLQFHKLKAYPTIEGGPYVAMVLYATTVITAIAFLREKDTNARERFVQKKIVEQEQNQAQTLLFEARSKKLSVQENKNKTTIADYHPEVGVLFAELSGFTEPSSELDPKLLVSNLTKLFSKYDSLAKENHIEKIRTGGVTWIGASGVSHPTPDHASNLIRFARSILSATKELREKLGIEVHVRIGIHAGPVVAGELDEGHQNFDLWGQTAELASKLASTSSLDTIQVSEHFRALVRTESSFSGPFNVEVKGYGRMNTWRKSA